MHVRFSPAERETITRAAETLRLRPSQFIRLATCRSAERFLRKGDRAKERQEISNGK